MRILGFTKVDWQNYERHYPKLLLSTFTTIRLPRFDKQYQENEELQIVLQPRSKDRLPLGIARVIGVELRSFYQDYSEAETRSDGFPTRSNLHLYLIRQSYAHPKKRHLGQESLKITLKWLVWYQPMIRYETLGEYALRRQDL